MVELNHLSLFSGIGGIDLAAEWAGFETKAFCENNKFCQEILGKHWPGVPIYDDIFTLTGQSLVERGIEPGSIKLISGGFPCQPYSQAGKRLGNEDDRALWPEMFRVIKEVRPDWVIGENVAVLISMALDGVLSDLESAGYTCQPVVLPACAVGAYHRRNRVFIIAHNDGKSSRKQQKSRGKCEGSSEPSSNGFKKPLAYPNSQRQQQPKRTEFEKWGWIGNGSENVPNPECFGRERDRKDRNGINPVGTETFNELERFHSLSEPARNGRTYWATEPPVGRVANGIPRRVDRLRALGNAVVPQQVYPILKAIADYERSLHND